MSLYSAIWKRKSVRQYDKTPLGEDELGRILQYANKLTPLYPHIATAHELVPAVSNILPVKTPHYFLIASETTDGYLENIGFMFQQMDLYLSDSGLGACWLGMAKPSAGMKTELPFVIAFAFGKAAENPHRDLSEFNRKPLTDIADGEDARIEAARLAPSAMNNQNWFFAAHDGKIDVFQKKAPLAPLEKKNKIDVGIALCHLCVATEQLGQTFTFAQEPSKEKKGYVYTGTVL